MSYTNRSGERGSPNLPDMPAVSPLDLPVEEGAILEEPATLKINARKDELDLETFTPSSVPEFSDDDLITAIFSQDAA